jgi:serine/threonine-protein kinase RsbW
MSEPLELTVASDLHNLALIAEFVTGAARQLGLSEQAAFEVQMAADEACANIVEHAYGAGVTGEITIRCELQGDDLLVAIRDRGRTFDPSGVPEPDVCCELQERQIGGLGIFFMRKLMDRIEYSFDPCTGNELRMYRRASR